MFKSNFQTCNKLATIHWIGHTMLNLLPPTKLVLFLLTSFIGLQFLPLSKTGPTGRMILVLALFVGPHKQPGTKPGGTVRLATRTILSSHSRGQGVGWKISHHFPVLLPGRGMGALSNPLTVWYWALRIMQWEFPESRNVHRSVSMWWVSKSSKNSKKFQKCFFSVYKGKTAYLSSP